MSLDKIQSTWVFSSRKCCIANFPGIHSFLIIFLFVFPIISLYVFPMNFPFDSFRFWFKYIPSLCVTQMGTLLKWEMTRSKRGIASKAEIPRKDYVLKPRFLPSRVFPKNRLSRVYDRAKTTVRRVPVGMKAPKMFRIGVIKCWHVGTAVQAIRKNHSREGIKLALADQNNRLALSVCSRKPSRTKRVRAKPFQWKRHLSLKPRS